MSDRRIEYMQLSTIEAAPRNPKKHATADIRGSVDRFGFVETPTIDERTGRLVAGHGRLDDLASRKRAGQEPPDGVRIDAATGDWLVPVTRGWRSRSDAEAEAYLVASNHLTTKGGWDNDELGELLSNLAVVEPDLFRVTGFTEEQLADLLGADDVAPDSADALADTEDNYSEQYGVIVMCTDEEDQERVYERLKSLGFNCKVVTT